MVNLQPDTCLVSRKHNSISCRVCVPISYLSTMLHCRKAAKQPLLLLYPGTLHSVISQSQPHFVDTLAELRVFPREKEKKTKQQNHGRLRILVYLKTSLAMPGPFSPEVHVEASACGGARGSMAHVQFWRGRAWHYKDIQKHCMSPLDH